MAVVLSDVNEMQRTSERLRVQGKRIGVVPTMGYLHNGHLKLIEIAKKRADVVITTIFVNPTQFSPSEDFARYPRDFQKDVHLSSAVGTDYIFAPETQSMYTPHHNTYVDVERITNRLEGKSRPGHFRGVATIVAKLFNITKPHIAVFGQKDAQQVVVVRQMINDLNVDVELVVCPIVREADGLAMSSRNTYLSSDQRSQAPILFKSLQRAEQLIREGERDPSMVIKTMEEMIGSSSTGVIDYISVANAATLEECADCRGDLLVSLAVRFGATRLIDNIMITV